LADCGISFQQEDSSDDLPWIVSLSVLSVLMVGAIGYELYIYSKVKKAKKATLLTSVS
jgi:hypothetical protein